MESGMRGGRSSRGGDESHCFGGGLGEGERREDRSLVIDMLVVSEASVEVVEYESENMSARKCVNVAEGEMS